MKLTAYLVQSLALGAIALPHPWVGMSVSQEKRDVWARNATPLATNGTLWTNSTATLEARNATGKLEARSFMKGKTVGEHHTIPENIDSCSGSLCAHFNHVGENQATGVAAQNQEFLKSHSFKKESSMSNTASESSLAEGKDYETCAEDDCRCDPCRCHEDDDQHHLFKPGKCGCSLKHHGTPSQYKGECGSPNHLCRCDEKKTIHKRDNEETSSKAQPEKLAEAIDKSKKKLVEASRANRAFEGINSDLSEVLLMTDIIDEWEKDMRKDKKKTKENKDQKLGPEEQGGDVKLDDEFEYDEDEKAAMTSEKPGEYVVAVEDYGDDYEENAEDDESDEESGEESDSEAVGKPGQETSPQPERESDQRPKKQH